MENHVTLYSEGTELNYFLLPRNFEYSLQPALPQDLISELSILSIRRRCWW